MAAISAERCELEAMRKEDGSWHPCHVSLSDDGFSIIVDFGSYAKEDIISSKEDALARLRFRSVPLQHGECFHVSEGESVLAMHKAQSRSLFFDALIEKPYRVKHSNRVHCRCTFEIKWLNSELKGESMTVSSNSIMKLSKKSITNHPVLDAFLSSLNPTNGVEAPSFLSFSDETSWEAYIHGMLEKQVEKISKSADESMKGGGDMLLGAKRGKLSGCSLNKASLTSPISLLTSQNNLRRSTRSQNKQEVEMELNKDSKDKPFLSPLAARAALASLMHELPKSEISICHLEIEDHVNPPLRDPKKHIKEQSLEVTCMFVKSDASGQDSVSMVSNPSQNTSVNSLMDARHLTRSSASNRKGSRKKSESNDSPEVSTIRERSTQVSKESEGKPNHATTDGKLHGRAVATRITRSTVQKEIIDSTAEVAQGSSNEKRNSPMNTTRLTRSAKKKDTSNPSVEQELGKSKLTEGSQNKEWEGKLSSSAITEHTRNPVTDGKPNGRPITTRITRLAVQKEIPHSTAEVAQGASNEKQSSPMNTTNNSPKSTTRLTRSAKRKGTSEASINQEIGSGKLTEVSQDMSEEDLVTPENDESKKKKLIPSPVDVVLRPQKKKTAPTIAATVTEKDQGEILQDTESSPTVEKKNTYSKRPESRFSPRLRFLPRTRSQKSSPIC